MVGLPGFMNEQGIAVECDDPERLVWYGMCGYWTDDFRKLAKATNIPACPQCRRPGFQTPWQRWFESVAKFEAQLGNEGYHQYVMEYLMSVKS